MCTLLFNSLRRHGRLHSAKECGDVAGRCGTLATCSFARASDCCRAIAYTLVLCGTEAFFCGTEAFFCAVSMTKNGWCQERGNFRRESASFGVRVRRLFDAKGLTGLRPTAFLVV